MNEKLIRFNYETSHVRLLIRQDMTPVEIEGES